VNITKRPLSESSNPAHCELMFPADTSIDLLGGAEEVLEELPALEIKSTSPIDPSSSE